MKSNFIDVLNEYVNATKHQHINHEQNKSKNLLICELNLIRHLYINILYMKDNGIDSTINEDRIVYEVQIAIADTYNNVLSDFCNSLSIDEQFRIKFTKLNYTGHKYELLKKQYTNSNLKRAFDRLIEEYKVIGLIEGEEDEIFD